MAKSSFKKSISQSKDASRRILKVVGDGLTISIDKISLGWVGVQGQVKGSG